MVGQQEEEDKIDNGGQDNEGMDSVMGKEEVASGNSNDNHCLGDSNSGVIEDEDVRERWIWEEEMRRDLGMPPPGVFEDILADDVMGEYAVFSAEGIIVVFDAKVDD
jgi:hypothetical protein